MLPRQVCVRPRVCTFVMYIVFMVLVSYTSDEIVFVCVGDKAWLLYVVLGSDVGFLRNQTLRKP